MHTKKPEVQCPHCDYVFTTDDMLADPTDLYALAPNEEIADVKCPHCDKEFWVQGSYTPACTTALAYEEDLIMADIENMPKSEQERREIFKKLDDGGLIAQDLVQQGAVHALSTLLKAGVSEQNVAEMLHGLRINAGLIRDEFERRGHDPIFSKDQTNFN